MAHQGDPESAEDASRAMSLGGKTTVLKNVALTISSDDFSGEGISVTNKQQLVIPRSYMEDKMATMRYRDYAKAREALENAQRSRGYIGEILLALSIAGFGGCLNAWLEPTALYSAKGIMLCVALPLVSIFLFIEFVQFRVKENADQLTCIQTALEHLPSIEEFEGIEHEE